MGIITNSTKERLDELEAEKKKLELAIAEETLEHPDVPKEYFEHWLRHFRSGDVDDPEYRKLLVDIFVNAIYVTDDGLRFALNFFDGVEIIPLRQAVKEARLQTRNLASLTACPSENECFQTVFLCT